MQPILLNWLAPVAQRLKSGIQQINDCPVNVSMDGAIHSLNKSNLGLTSHNIASTSLTHGGRFSEDPVNYRARKAILETMIRLL